MRRLFVDAKVLKDMPSEFSVLLPMNAVYNIVTRNNTVIIEPLDNILMTIFIRGEIRIPMSALTTSYSYVVNNFEKTTGLFYEEGKFIDSIIDVGMHMNKCEVNISVSHGIVIRELPFNFAFTKKDEITLGREWHDNAEEIRRLVVNVLKALAKRETVNSYTVSGYWPFRAVKRVSRSGAYVNVKATPVSHEELSSVKPEYVVAEITVDNVGGKVTEVDTEPEGRLLGWLNETDEGNKHSVYILAPTGEKITVDVWQRNYLETYEVITALPIRINKIE